MSSLELARTTERVASSPAIRRAAPPCAALGSLCQLRLAFQNAEHFVLANDQQLLAVHLDFVAGVLTQKDAVADFHVQRDKRAIFQAFAFPNRRHFGFLGLLLSGIWDMQTTLHLLLFFDPFDHDTVIER